MIPCENETFICFADLKRLFRRHKKKLIRIAVVSTVAIFCYLVCKPSQYVASATFKQATSSKTDQFLALNNFLKNMEIADSHVSPRLVMISKRIFRDAVQKTGTQIQVREKGRFLELLSRVSDNISLECGFSLSDPDPFVFSKVVYNGEHQKTLFLKFVSASTYAVLNERQEILFQGKLKQKASFENLEFILEKTPDHLKLDVPYQIVVHPWLNVVERLLKSLEIRVNKTDKNLLHLYFRDANRHFAASFLNQVMESYQNYLKEEDEQITGIQLSYLEKRQRELSQKLDRDFQDHVLYMKSNLSENGSVGLQEEIKMLSLPKEQYMAKLLEIDLNLKRLEKVRDDRLALSRVENTHQDVSCAEKELQGVSLQLEETQVLLDQIQNDNLQSEDLSLLKDPTGLVALWIESIKKSQNETIAEKQQERDDGKTQLCTLLSNEIDTLSVKKKMLQENIFFKTSSQYEFQGITLQMAENLYIQYNKELDGIQAGMRQLFFLRDQMQDPEFELTSLGTILGDSVTQEMVQKASALSLQLRDVNNRSQREQQRLKEELVIQKKFITNHIGQSIELHKLRAKLVEDKIASLQEVSIELIKNEKALLNDKLHELTQRMNELPEKWRMEQQINIKKEMGSNMMEAISQLVESKNADHNLFHVESRPLDAALAPLKAKHPGLFLFSIGSGVIISFFVFAFHLCRGIANGLPVSMENLKMQGQKCCGSLSSYADSSLNELGAEDLETLRKMSAWMSSFQKRGVCVLLHGGDGPNYAHGLSKLLTLQERKVLLLECVFNGSIAPEKIPGIFQYLKGDIAHCPLQQKEGYDYLPPGGTTRHAAEMLQTAKFSSFLEEMKQHYDVILIFSRDVDLFVSTADLCVMTLCEESIEDLNEKLLLCQKPVTFVGFEAV